MIKPNNEQAIITCVTASERSFPIKLGLANIVNTFCSTKKHCTIFFYAKMESFDLFSDFPYLLQGGRTSHRKPGLSHEYWASHRETWPLKRRPVWSGGQASHREARPFTGRPGLSQCASYLARNTHKIFF